MDAFKQAHANISQRVDLDRNPESLLSFFYQYSIVGFERATGAAGLEHHFRYLDETIRFNPDARSYMVHRGLKETLELRDIGDAVTTI